MQHKLMRASVAPSAENAMGPQHVYLLSQPFMNGAYFFRHCMLLGLQHHMHLSTRYGPAECMVPTCTKGLAHALPLPTPTSSAQALIAICLLPPKTVHCSCATEQTAMSNLRAARLPTHHRCKSTPFWPATCWHQDKITHS